MIPTTDTVLPLLAVALFVLAILHTFSTKFFERLAHAQPHHAGIWHLLGEVEVVFGFWALLLVIVLLILTGKDATMGYLESRDFTEPMFVFSIMVIAASRPILDFAGMIIRAFARVLPVPSGMATYFLILFLTPLFGSFITEPAAMTLAAMMLRDTLFSQRLPERLKYVALGVLFVNISIGGTLTPFAAPPVLMVAGKWNWDFAFMMSVFGWKATLAVFINALAATIISRGALDLSVRAAEQRDAAPLGVIAVHLIFLTLVVAFAHHPVIFVGVLCFFLGYASAYKRHQNPLILREAFLVAFFLAGLIVLGGQQQWWLQALLMKMGTSAVFYGTAALTAVTDNAALTYLGSLVEGLSDEFKIALLSGAVAGGGLTIIANAPNPAGAAILKEKFSEKAIRPLNLFLAAAPPTLVVILVFRCL